MTVEASLAFSVFLCVSSLFFTFFQGQRIELRLQKALDEVCEEVAVWSGTAAFVQRYTGTDLLSFAEGSRIGEAVSGGGESLEALLSEETDLISEAEAFLKAEAGAAVWQPLLLKRIENKAGLGSPNSGMIRGLSLSGSTLCDRELDLVLSYEVVSGLSFPVALRYPVVQRSCRRLWIGTGGSIGKAAAEEEEIMVYVTSQGSAYHLTTECRALAIHPSEINAADVPGQRNRNGGRYYPCEQCLKGKKVTEGTVWITPYGDRYHAAADCGEIRRDIRSLALSEAVQSYTPCHYCASGG